MEILVPHHALDEGDIGISGRLGASVSGDRCDVTRAGLEEVQYGGTVAAGDPLTSDANGKAISGRFPVILTQTAYRIDMGQLIGGIMPKGPTLMIGGKKSTAEGILYGALDII